jgi:RimJ/RimL family protein N-acetyltransferase
MSFIEEKTFQTKAGVEFKIRTAAVTDAAAINDISKSVMNEKDYMAAEADEYEFTVLQQQERIQKILNSPNQIILVIEGKGSVVGYFQFTTEEKRRLAHRGVMLAAIVKEWREGQLGSKVLEVAIEWASNNKMIETMTAPVFGSNHRSAAVMIKYGFEEYGRLKNAIKISDGHYEDVIYLRKDVKVVSNSLKKAG